MALKFLRLIWSLSNVRPDWWLQASVLQVVYMLPALAAKGYRMVQGWLLFASSVSSILNIVTLPFFLLISAVLHAFSWYMLPALAAKGNISVQRLVAVGRLISLAYFTLLHFLGCLLHMAQQLPAAWLSLIFREELNPTELLRYDNMPEGQTVLNFVDAAAATVLIGVTE
ncbi:hypothetical protein HAX54_019552 [Datura stramonium]|uniref:Uncharacterized protein n=1 Tax=Datura stramonium TaxID=4076 RepID=A0ABS8UPC1_DATST|nr:hypothetical protein [Datura stramonium]